MGGTENASGLSDFLLELYHDASECTPDELRLRVLNNLQRFIPFDFGVWGGGWADGRLVTDLTVLNQSEAILGEWDTVAQEDAFCGRFWHRQSHLRTAVQKSATEAAE